MSFRKMMPGEQIAPGKQWVTVTSGMSGHFAVVMWMNNEETDLGPFGEPWDTGFGRYATKAEAQAEALEIAEQNDLPYDL